MCPACMASAALVAGSMMSTGGLAALAVKVGFGKKRQNDTSTNVKERRNDDGNDERNHE